MSRDLAVFFFRLAVFFLIIWALIQFSYKEPDELDNYEVSSGPWAVNGIRLGADFKECRRILGEPVKSKPDAYSPKITKDWKTSTNEVSVVFENAQTGGACEIRGRTLTDHGGKVVISKSAGESEVKAILKSASMIKRYSPGGSGVISCSSVHTATHFICKDPAGYYSIYFYKGALSNITATTQYPR